jgi:hypothetical protein
MDHMDGIKAFFEEFSPPHFWDTDNRETKEFGEGSNGGFNQDDWDFHLSFRNSESDPPPVFRFSRPSPAPDFQDFGSGRNRL